MVALRLLVTLLNLPTDDIPAATGLDGGAACGVRGASQQEFIDTRATLRILQPLCDPVVAHREILHRGGLPFGCTIRSDFGDGEAQILVEARCQKAGPCLDLESTRRTSRAQIDCRETEQLSAHAHGDQVLARVGPCSIRIQSAYRTGKSRACIVAGHTVVLCVAGQAGIDVTSVAAGRTAQILGDGTGAGAIGLLDL